MQILPGVAGRRHDVELAASVRDAFPPRSKRTGSGETLPPSVRDRILSERRACSASGLVDEELAPCFLTARAGPDVWSQGPCVLRI